MGIKDLFKRLIRFKSETEAVESRFESVESDLNQPKSDLNHDLNQPINEQKFMEIPKAQAADFQKATQRIYTGGTDGSRIQFLVLEVGK